MSTTTTTDLAAQLAKLEKNLEDFWLAPIFPAIGTTTAGIKRRALNAGRKAYAILQAAEAAGDKATAKAADKLARSLLPYAKTGRAN